MKWLVAIDGSEGSLHALIWALDHVVPSTTDQPTAEPPEPEKTERFILLHVQQPIQYTMHPIGPHGVAVYAPAVAESLKKTQQDNAQRVLSAASNICNERLSNIPVQVTVETVVMEGDAKEVICEAAYKFQADVLVVGSRGHGKWKRAFLGSVSDYCAHHVNCPVLIVKQSKETHEQSI
ncbi:hypothetical protein HPP92_028273 [Vanilla planifolia]|uniref:UspA domain-containing protein n=1 Tax=Vanilla planifolia TaxID=51239 RepID=A0A835P984_VANPL|nr:hypothetical protein HPP92_028273 [Vanilla planifolia]KAG0447606.1 hypothetical protein HPP92_028254 [Vanilla planifolia]